MVLPEEKQPRPGGVAFDRHARTYDEMHGESIKASGEPTTYFAAYKLRCLIRLGAKEPVLDFGCGIGNLTEQLVKKFGRVHAYDPSAESLRFAKDRAPGAELHAAHEDIPNGVFETVVLSGVLHHVDPSERMALLATAKDKLAPGGTVVVFEHNPLNPLTRRAVAACAFDDDAVLLWPWEVRRILLDAGFREANVKYIVFFPRLLAVLRPLEAWLSRAWFGAQTMTTATKPR